MDRTAEFMNLCAGVRAVSERGGSRQDEHFASLRNRRGLVRPHAGSRDPTRERVSSSRPPLLAIGSSFVLAPH